MTWVVDASVALKWFLHERANETDRAVAAQLLDAFNRRSIDLLAPPHFVAEVLAVLAREAPQTMERGFADLLRMQIPERRDAAVYGRAMRLSAELNHHLFDTLYHAVALETDGATLITADESYARKARALGRVMLLSEWQPPGQAS